MADNEAQTVAPNVAGYPAPPTQGVTQFTLAMTVNEVVLTFGNSRATMQIGPGGAATPVLVTEWLVSLSLTTTMAKLMQENIAKSLERYEQLFGKLPADPAMSVVINDALRPSA